MGGDFKEFVTGTKENDAQHRVRMQAEARFRLEDERLEAQERELDEISAKAKRAGIRSRRSRARRIGRASTIMAGQNQSNFQRLAESRKKLLGSGA